MEINRKQFPAETQAQGMAAQASQWFLVQVDKNDMTEQEAMLVAQDIMNTAIRLITRNQRPRRRKQPA